MGFIKGQKAWVHSRDSRQSDYETTVVGVGKKYITCQQNPTHPKQKFDIDSKEDVSWSNYTLYESKDAYNEANETLFARIRVRNLFNNKLYSLNREQLEKIAAILSVVD